MSDALEHIALCEQLKALLAANVLTDTAQKTGERLVKRLQSDILVFLAGPEEPAKEHLHQALAICGLPRTALHLASWPVALDLAQVDVCIWCTTEFGKAEAAAWQNAPERLKDHSFLVAVSNAGPSGKQLGRAALHALDEIAAEEFYGLFPVTLGGRAGGPTENLVREVAKLVKMGLAAATDNAQMFLRMHQEKQTLVPPQIPAKPARTAVTEFPPQNATALPQDQTAATEVYQKALGTMRHHLTGLEPLLAAQQEPEFLKIMSICEETSAAVADVFSASDLHDPELVAFKQEALAAADRILLMSLEGGVSPAVTAVTTVLQLRREMEVQIAC